MNDEETLGEAFAGLDFLRGCWGAHAGGGRRVTEDWYARSGDVRLGVSRTVDDAGALQEYEFLEIRLDRAAGAVTYTPWLDGRRLNTFRLEAPPSGGAPVAAFADPGNVGLKRIVYTAKGPDVLGVRLSGVSRDGRAFEFGYDLAREACASRF